MDRQELHQSVIEGTKFTFARSGGNGGQNVNKVNTKVHAVLPFNSLRGLNETELLNVRRKLDGCINAEEMICVDVDDERLQGSNRRIALERMEARVAAAAYIQPKRKKTKPSRASKEKRLKAKKLRSQIKKIRSARDFS